MRKSLSWYLNVGMLLLLALIFFLWTNQLDDAILDPTVNAKEPTYFVIQVTSDSGCIATDSVYLDLNQIISNFLSPNNDNQNDTWEVRPLSSISNCTVMIFDGFFYLFCQKNDYFPKFYLKEITNLTVSEDTFSPNNEILLSSSKKNFETQVE